MIVYITLFTFLFFLGDIKDKNYALLCRFIYPNCKSYYFFNKYLLYVEFLTCVLQKLFLLNKYLLHVEFLTYALRIYVSMTLTIFFAACCFFIFLFFYFIDLIAFL